MAEDKKNPKEASNIFHSIMKASVKPTPKKLQDEEKGNKEESKPLRNNFYGNNNHY